MSILSRAYSWRLAAAVIGILVALHLLFSVTHPTYSVYTPLRIGQDSSVQYDEDLYETSGSSRTLPVNATGDTRRKANAVFVVLVRNSELWQIVDSMKQMEDRFNWWANYDYVFLNDEPFEEKFKVYTRKITKANCHYGLIEASQWKQPEWIDEEKARAAREADKSFGVVFFLWHIYIIIEGDGYKGRNLCSASPACHSDSVSYRSMCNYNSGYFFRHPLLAEYDYYWRIEPDVKFYCDIDYDPFLFMQDQKKVYGFTISIFEFIETIPTLWDAVKDFMRQHPEYVAEGNSMDFISDDGGETYNKCHFWSNFEIADLNFWRSEAYMDFYTHLEQTGGFWYERWGDAPVHSIAASLFLPRSAVHYFEDIGYRHSVYQHCPQGELHTKGRCWCDESDDFAADGYSCTSKYLDMMRDEL